MRLFREQQPGNETLKEILNAMAKKRAKTKEQDIVLNGPREASVREEIRAVSSTI